MISDQFSIAPEYFVCSLGCVLKSIMFNHHPCTETVKLVGYHLSGETAMTLTDFDIICTVSLRFCTVEPIVLSGLVIYVAL
jgi:hypothetical protein